jgi:hypothetical protein
MRYLPPSPSYASLHFQRTHSNSYGHNSAEFALGLGLFDLHLDPVVGPSADLMYVFRSTENPGWWGQSELTGF